VLGPTSRRIEHSVAGSVSLMPAGAPSVDTVSTVPTVAVPIESPLERLYRDLAPAVLGYLRAQGVEEPEDVLGEVFLQVVRDLPRFHGDDAARRRWVFTITHNRLVDHHRRRRRRPCTVPTTEGREAADSRPVDHDLLDPRLIDALRMLTRKQRDVVVLRFVADLSIADVAKLVRRRPSAVKALQSRALARLASLLEEQA
jgi:RNA polymerase sigma-70 factor (ECF subfamily)